ncbi:unnamed protein product [Calypogeia fissa]
MDSNKDEAMKCMAIGKAAMEAGDRARAVKFLGKAQRLYPNPQVDALLSALYEGNGKQAADSKPTRNGDSAEGKSSKDENGKEGIRHRNGVNQSGSSAGASPSSGGGSAGSDASPEQIEIVARIRRTKDYYQILSVTKECTEEDVRKAYRKISLKVHPDKNKAPGAEEAFKAVSKAFMTLSDVELREKYDRFGPEEEQEQQNHIRRRRYHNGGNPNVFYEDMFEANDIFNSFFFGMQQQQGGAFRRAHFTRPAGGGGRQENSNNFLGLLQLLPILALFLFSYFPFSQPIYQLDKVAPYHYMHKTKENGVNFYVKAENFNQEYPDGTQSRRQVELQVERDYRDILIHNCRIEQSHQRWGHKRETPHCDKLQRFVRVS